MMPEYTPSPSVTSTSRMRAKASNLHGPTPIPMTNYGVPSVTSRQRASALPLDLTSTEMVTDIAHKPKPKKDRPFGLEEAPTYYPTEEEFKDPYQYIKSISEEGKEYGIIKVVPPDSWRPSFALDSEQFWFKTRRQELNSMEGGTRANLNFLDQLHKFHKQHGVTLNKLPSVDRRPLDLYHLKKGVDMRGGFDEVCKKKQWAEIGRELGYSGKIMTSLSSSLKGAYQKYVAPYERYLVNAKPLVQKQIEAENGPSVSPVKRARTVSNDSTVDASSRMGSVSPKSADIAQFQAINELKRPAPLSESPPTPSTQSTDLISRDPSESHEDRRSKRLRSGDGQQPTVVGSNMILHRPTGIIKRLSIESEPPKLGENCEICGSGENELSMLLCDGCDAGYHMGCLTPPVKSVPNYDWYCDKCLVGTGEFGFEEGQVYSLRQFQEKARNFKERYFSGKMPIDPKTNKPKEVTESEVEEEFWRLVEDVNDTVEVEYGADIHSTIHGSGFPTLERNPLDAYAADPWNLNIMPLHEKSLLRHIKTDVSGMTVPWLYVGMIFSTFCWHSEDHFTYSANYQHFGATKTWYGIPGADAEKFEDAMRKAVPELFEQQPDLLFQLVTMLSPKALKAEGVRCYAVDQRPGEFVITFPQAYHAGFNHGFNFNEAVNFAPADWEPFGKLGVEVYQDYRKLPVFSHDELLITAASRDNSIETATWCVLFCGGWGTVSDYNRLGPALASMQEQEFATRQHIRELCPNIKEEYLPKDLPDADFQCAYCNTYCYLSQLKCSCTPHIVCLNHYDELCECDRSNLVMRVRLTDEDITNIVNRVNDRASQPRQWLEKYERLMADSEKPSIRSLRSLLAESEKIPYPMPQVGPLRKTVEAANEWVEEAQNMLARKQQHRRKNERPLRRGSIKSTEIVEEHSDRRKPHHLIDLLVKGRNMPFYANEIDYLQERVEQVNEFIKHADDLLANPTNNHDTYVTLIETGIGFNLDFEQIEKLENKLAQLQWLEKVEDSKKTYVYLPDLGAMLVEAYRVGFNENEPIFREMLKAKVQGDAWEQDVKRLLQDTKLDYGLLEAKYDEASSIPVTRQTYDALERVLLRHKEVNEAITAYLDQSSAENVHERATYRDARRAVDLMKDLLSLSVKQASVIDLERKVKAVDEWIRKGKRLFGKGTASQNILRSHLESVEKRNRACFSLDDKPRLPIEPASREASPEADAPRKRSDSYREVFCICRMPESGLMIECESCHEWYHNRCLKISRGAIKDSEYTCPICDYRVRIFRESHRPRLEDLENWEKDGADLPLYPDELGILEKINAAGRSMREFLRQMFASPLDLGTTRFYLRKLEGADILLALETNYLRNEAHRLAPVAYDAPPTIETSLDTPRQPRLKQEGISPAPTDTTVETRDEIMSDAASIITDQVIETVNEIVEMSLAELGEDAIGGGII